MSIQTQEYKQDCDNNYKLILLVTEESTAVSNNTSTISWVLKLKSANANFADYRIGWSVSINGTVVSSKSWSSAPQRSIGKNSEITIISSSGTEGGGNVTVSHNSDGTKSMSVSATITMSKSSYSPIDGSSGTGTKTVSGNMTLTTIPRASTMSYPSSMTMGTAVTFTINRASTSFTHTLKYSFGNLSNKSISTGITSSYSWTPPTSLGSKIPSSSSGTITFVLQTYNGGTLIGSNTYTATLSVPSYTPTANLSTSLTNPSGSTVASWGVAVKGITKINYSITGSTSYGATVSNYKAIISATGETKTTSTGTSNAVLNTGSTTVKARVKDSRGKWSNQVTKTITVYNYNPPKITSCSAYRCNQDGTKNSSGEYLRLYCTASIGDDSSVGGRNSINIVYDADGNTGTLTSGVASIIGTFNLDRTYNVNITATDTVGSSVERIFKIPTELITMHMKEGGRGVAFSTYSTIDDAVDFGTWSPVGMVLGLGKAKARIPEYTDLNTMTDPGVYNVTSTAQAQTLSNCPSTYAGTLRIWASQGVIGSASSTWHRVIQEYIDYKCNIYIRGIYSGETAGQYTYESWKKITTTVV